MSSTPQQKRNALIMVACATIIQVIAQLLIKAGTELLPPDPTLAQTAIGMVTILPLFAGYACYGLFTVVMVLALKHGELSMTFPILALSYAWVAAASAMWLNESLNPAKIAGIAVIVSGVAILGRGGAKTA